MIRTEHPNRSAERATPHRPLPFPCPASHERGEGLPPRIVRASRGVTLIELLCVMTIITILACLLVPTVMRVYSRVRAMSQEMEGPEVASLLMKEVRGYCAVNSNYVFSTKSDLADKCFLGPKPRDWVLASTTDFVPFASPDPATNIVMAFHYGPKQALLYTFTKGDLTIIPPPK